MSNSKEKAVKYFNKHKDYGDACYRASKAIDIAISSERERIKGIIKELIDRERFDEEPNVYINGKELLEMIDKEVKTE